MKIALAVLAIIALAALLSSFLVQWPDSENAPPGAARQTYPWQIEPAAEYHSIRIFSLVPGHSTLAQAAAHFGHRADLALFLSRPRSAEATDKEYSLEAYFARIETGALLGRVVLRLEATPAQLAQWAERAAGTTISETGVLRSTPLGADRPTIEQLTIGSLTFLPLVNLDAEVLRGRFGEPGRRYRDGDGVEHWAYPERGLTIALGERAGEVFEYRAPSDFVLPADAVLINPSRPDATSGSPGSGPAAAPAR